MTISYQSLTLNNPELAQVRSAIRDFLFADQAQHGWQPTVDSWLSSWDEQFSARLGAAGFLGLTIPREYGGQGLSHLHRYVVAEELLARGAPVAAHWVADRQVAPVLLHYGSEFQRTTLLPRIAAGRLFSAIGMSEPQAGSDLAAATCRATPSGDGWKLNGRKIWCSGAHHAHQIVVLARTSPLDQMRRHAGFTQFIVPADANGVRIEPITLMSGEHHFNEVTFEDVLLTAADVLGIVGNGWRQVTAELSFERSGPERVLSTAPLLIEVLRGASAQTNPRVEIAAGELLARWISLRSLSISVARRLAAGEDATNEAALVKDLGTQFERESVELATNLVDVYDVPRRPGDALEPMLRTAKLHAPLFTLRGGTNEVLRGIVARGMGVR
jgi:acyl-CoA dehydrogenase